MSLESILRSVKRGLGVAVLGAASLVGVGLGGGARDAAAAPPSGIQGVFSSAADNPGLQGTRWGTTAWFEQDAVDEALLTLCATNNAVPADASQCQQYALPRGVVVTIPNAWAGFAAPPPGGLLWKVDGVSVDQLAAFARTYTLAPVGKPGTLGAADPGLLVSELPLVGTSQFVPAAMRDGFRTNVGFLNATALPSDVLVRLHTGGGNIVAQRTYSLPGFGWQQLTDVFGTLGVAPFKNGYVEVIQMTGERLAVYGSNIDNTSGNPTTFIAKTAYTGQRSLFVPSAAHLNGYNGTTWITDVNYLNASNVNQSAAGLGFLAYNHDNAQQNPPSQGWLMGSGEMRNFPDVLFNLFGYTNLKGSLQVQPMDSHLIWASTFNDRGADGTFGQATPSIFGETDRITGSLEGILVGLSQAAVGDDNNGYRSAIGLLNTGTSAAVFHVDLYDDAGHALGSLDENVPAMSLLQLDKVYQLVTPNAVNNGRAVITVTSGQGFAYGSIIDNQNGAPTTEYATIRTPFVDPAVQYIQQWFPTNDARFYLSNEEIRAMINGTANTRSYAPDLATILIRSPANTNGFTEQQMEQWLRQQVDGVLSNGEVWGAWDPFLWDNHAAATEAVVFYGDPNGGLAPFPLLQSDMQAVYQLVEGLDAAGNPNGGFLSSYLPNHASEYGNLDPNTPPTDPWNAQDPNQ